MFSSLTISLALAVGTIGAIPVDRPERPERERGATRSEVPRITAPLNAPSRSGVTFGLSMAVSSSHVLFKSGNTRQDWIFHSLSASVGVFLSPNAALLANVTFADGRAELLGAGLRLQLWPHDRIHVFGGVEIGILNGDHLGVGFSGGVGVSVMTLKHHSLFLFARGNYVLNTEQISQWGHGENAATVQFGLGWQFH